MDNAASERMGETIRLGSFEIVRKLARGGMAEIFLARTRGPSGADTLVVLKRILPKYATNHRFVQLFLDEAKLAASLDHPNIAQVYDIGMADGGYFFTMEYLHGQDVRSILHRRWSTGEPFPIEHAVQIARDVGSALHFAHDQQRGDGTLLGIVHRDVSPSNIVVTYDGAIKLLDFGVAKTTASTVKTRTGALKGKVAYMSPEQARGAPLDRRSDIFSLGIVLWEMVTTQRLFRGENDLATLQLIIHQPPRPPSAVRPDCPPELERIVLRALAQHPDARYPTAAHLVAELDALVREHGLEQSPQALSATVSQLFAPELAAWRDARAAGVPLADHLNNVGDLTQPVHESDFIELSAGDSEDDGDDDELGPLYRLDDVAVDDEKTEHVPAMFDLLPALAAETAGPADPAESDTMPRPGTDALASLDALAGTPVPAPRATPSPLFPPGPPGPPGAPGGRHKTPNRSFAPVPAASEPTAPLTSSPATLLGPLAPMSSSPAPLGGFAPAPGSPVMARTADDEMTPSTLVAAVAPRVLGAPFGGAPGVSSAPFAVAPWQSGQPPATSRATPGATPRDRVARSWAVIDLPAFDPEAFERHRRIVLRVAAAVVGAVILLAILAGHC